MSPSRTRKNSDLPDNLYYTGKYPYYRNPVSGKKTYLTGKSRAEAISLANQANSRLSETVKTQAADYISDLIDNFIKNYLPLKEYAARTEKGVLTRLKKIKTDFTGQTLQDTTVLTLRDWLEPFTPHARKGNRLVWIDIYKYAMSEGLCESNLAERTLTKKIPKRKRDRLTLIEFNLIYEKSPEWFQIAMLACLLTLQRREDLINIKASDFNEGILTLIQNKTGTGLRITANSTLENLFKRSTATDVLSPYLIHKKPEKVRREYVKRKAHWSQVTPEMLTREFKKQRDAAIQSTATWYEIKSLGSRLLIEQGFDIEFVQLLCGHAKESTTQIYLDNGINWKQAEAGLEL